MQRLKFLDIFQKNADGSLSPKRVINVGGATFGPGVAFGRGVNFGGIDFFLYQNSDVAVEDQDGVLLIKGFYTT